MLPQLSVTETAISVLRNVAADHGLSLRNYMRARLNLPIPIMAEKARQRRAQLAATHAIPLDSLPGPSWCVDKPSDT